MKGGVLLKLSLGLEILHFYTDDETASVSVFVKMLNIKLGYRTYF